MGVTVRFGIACGFLSVMCLSIQPVRCHPPPTSPTSHPTSRLPTPSPPRGVGGASWKVGGAVGGGGG